jgi:hypothetical protein
MKARRSLCSAFPGKSSRSSGSSLGASSFKWACQLSFIIFGYHQVHHQGQTLQSNTRAQNMESIIIAVHCGWLVAVRTGLSDMITSNVVRYMIASL